MLLTTPAQYSRAAHVIDTSGLAEQLSITMNRAEQGRPGTLPLRTYLIGAYLAIEEKASFKNTTILKVLTQGLSQELQQELGVRYRDKDGNVRVIERHHLDYHSRWLPKRLSYTDAAAKKWDLDLDDAEKKRRQTGLQTAMDAVFESSIVDGSGSWYSLDGSGTWSWGKARYRLDDPDDIRTKEAAGDDTDAAPESAASDPAEDAEEAAERTRDEVVDGDTQAASGDAADLLDVAGKVKPTFDPEAAIGTKTSKSGKRESFYGYMIDAAVAIHQPGGEKKPVVMRRMVLSPASTDVVEPTLTILDSLRKTTDGVSNIVVDRHYSYKKVDRWADELRSRGISQHFDLRKDEQGFKDINGMRLAAGWMHCPATPDELGVIDRPGPGASKATKDEFLQRIKERSTWAMQRHEDLTTEGRTRWVCPALNGDRGCPLQPGTVEVANVNGLPIVANPPAAETAPRCCTQRTVSDRSEPMRKHQQPHYWGSAEWQLAYDLRTYVEGLFGSLKNPDTERVSRGFTKFPGLVMMSLGLTLAAAVCNVRHQRRFWDGRDDRPEHPLLTADPEFLGWRELTQAEVDQSDDAEAAARAA